MTDESSTRAVTKLLYANGIDASTGEYAMPPITPADFKKGIKGHWSEPDAKQLKNWSAWKRSRKFSIKEGLEPRNLEEAGWGLVFPVNADPAVVDALRPLTEWRKQQAGDLFRIYADNAKGAVRPMNVDSKGSWLARQGAENYGPVDPQKVPYYLLLVGDPNQIDYRFQYLLDVQYAVGRICFDTPAEYAQYAESVVRAEKEHIQRRRDLAFFGVANNGDAATQLSEEHLIKPLFDYTSTQTLKDNPAWNIRSVVKEEANKNRLGSLLGGAETPGLLFTASHGMSFRMDNPQMQAHRQGALLCQDWPGPSAWRGKPISEDFYFSADDLSSDADLQGLISFFFACYGAGMPQYDEFYRAAFKDRAQIAEKSFISRLPQRMLAHPRGGALAVIGHVERAWGYSFLVDESRSLEAFRSALDALMTGAPIGLAFEYFNERYAEFATDLTDKLQSDDWNPVDPLEMANAWTATNDAKNYVVLGDPAVRVCVADQPGDQPEAIRPLVITSQPGSGDVGAPEGPSGNGGSAESSPQSPTAPVQTLAPDYGIIEDLTQAKNSVGAALAQITQKLSTFLSTALESASILEVNTYTSTNMDQVQVKGSQISGAKRRVVTLIQIDGDIQQVVPVDEDGAIDKDLLEVHREMVRQAQESRTEMLRAVVSAISGLTGLGGSK